jgi:3,4-dehydroadipyl-CoA semialdehyde dehydrogenase
MTELLPNHLAGRWQSGTGSGTALVDPVLGDELVRVDAAGLDLAAGFEFARQTGRAALQALRYRERGEMLAAAVRVLQANREAYDRIATANSGTTQADSGVDIEGAIYTLSVYAKLAASLPEGQFLPDGEPQSLARDGSFATRHLQVPVSGLALFINAFNFPAWGLWEKAAPALLSGVPVVIKPATVTAWLTQRMVKDVVDAGVFPPGALSVVCGSSAGLLDALQPQDVLSFTGSAETAELLRAHPAVTRRSVRVNIEADSVNSALLMPGATPGSDAFDLFVKELVREMTQKSGQKCTAIRRAFVPASVYGAVAEAVGERLARIVVGNPRNETVRMGSLVSRAQLAAVREGLARLSEVAQVLHDGSAVRLLDADPEVACCVGPTLLGLPTPEAVLATALVHEVEIFGPVATLMPYADLPQALHGGPGRAGGGEELGGLRALNFYHRRVAVQGAPAVLASL